MPPAAPRLAARRTAARCPVERFRLATARLRFVHRIQVLLTMTVPALLLRAAASPLLAAGACLPLNLH